VTAVKPRVATLTGTFLAPGVSRNGRLYSPALIRSAVTRMQERLNDPQGSPLTMLSHHAAGDDSTRIAGRITTVELQADGSATFEADLADTDAGRTIAALTGGTSPYLSNVSIRGWWVGETRTVTHSGQQVETADDLEVDGVDFTKSPGVPAARITASALAETHGRIVITESVEDITMTETDPKPHADRGYLTDGTHRLPVSTATECLASWAAVNLSEAYTGPQAKRIKGRIREAAGAFGMDVRAMTHMAEAAAVEAAEEAYASMNVDNGQGSITVSGYTNEPADLAIMARRICLAALAGLLQLDPDNDGDIDLMDDPESSPTGESTTLKEHPVTESISTSPEAAAVEAAPSTPATETVAAIEAAPAVEAAPARTLTDADVTALAAALRPTTETSPEAVVVEATEVLPAVVEKTIAEQIAEAVETAIDARVNTTRFGGTFGRKGLATTTETTEKPLHEMTDEEWKAHKADSVSLFLG
jgi:hypothetical protein